MNKMNILSFSSQKTADKLNKLSADNCNNEVVKDNIRKIEYGLQGMIFETSDNKKFICNNNDINK